MSVVSGMSGMLHRIDESEYEESSVGSIARRPVPPGMGSRTESSSTFTTDHDRSSANTEGPQGLDAVRIPDDSAMGHGTGVTTILAGDEYGGIAAGGKRNSLGRKAEAGTSPGVSKRCACARWLLFFLVGGGGGEDSVSIGVRSFVVVTGDNETFLCSMILDLG